MQVSRQNMSERSLPQQCIMSLMPRHMSTADNRRRRESAKVSRKEKMVAVAEALLRERGIGGVTTRAIAEAVPCSEGAIYVHFKDRLELLLAVLQQALPEMLAPLHELEEKAGKGT